MLYELIKDGILIHAGENEYKMNICDETLTDWFTYSIAMYFRTMQNKDLYCNVIKQHTFIFHLTAPY